MAPIRHASTPTTNPFRDDGHDQVVRRVVPKTASASLYHLKECKIRGSIGDPGEKDKLGYYGLMSEIKER